MTASELISKLQKLPEDTIMLNFDYGPVAIDSVIVMREQYIPSKSREYPEQKVAMILDRKQDYLEFYGTKV